MRVSRLSDEKVAGIQTNNIIENSMQIKNDDDDG
jgi:hypothetical protein